MSSTPTWALAIAYWLHMLATVAWIGGLVTLALLVLPAARKALEPGAYAALLEGLRRRFDSLAWFSLVILAGTGMFQMSASPNYQGFLRVENAWAAAILVKHLLFFAMMGVSGYMTWGLLPRLQRLALRQARLGQEAETEEVHQLLHQELLLVRLNLILGVLVLALTAVARSSI